MHRTRTGLGPQPVDRQRELVESADADRGGLVLDDQPVAGRTLLTVVREAHQQIRAPAVDVHVLLPADLVHLLVGQAYGVAQLVQDVEAGEEPALERVAAREAPDRVGTWPAIGAGGEGREPGVEDLQVDLGVGVLDHQPVHAPGQQTEAAGHRIARDGLDREHQRLRELGLGHVDALRKLPLPVDEPQQQPVEHRAPEAPDHEWRSHHRDVIRHQLIDGLVRDTAQPRDLFVGLARRPHDGVDDLVGLSHFATPPQMLRKW